MLTFKNMLKIGVIRVSFFGAVVIGLIWFVTAIVDYNNKKLDERNSYRRHIILSGLSSVFISSTMIFSYLELSNNQRIFFSGLALATITIGSFILSTFIAAQIAWFIPLAIVIIIGCIENHISFCLFWVILLVNYFIMIMNNVNHFSKTFKESFVLQAEATKQTELIGLLLREFENQSKDWLWETDSNLLLTHIGKQFKNATGKTDQELYKKNFIDLLSEYLPDGKGKFDYKENLENILKDSKSFNDVIIEVNVNEEKYWWLLSAKPIYSKTGNFNGWIGVGRDITEQRKYEEAIIWQANHDVLTKIKNKYFFQDSLQEYISKQGDNEEALFLIKIANCARFKSLRGQSVSDKIMQEVGKRILAFSNNENLTARFDGYEFAVVIQMQNKNSTEITNELVDILKEPLYINREIIELEFNIGLAVYPKDAQNADKLLQCADLALSAAKESGNNSIRIYDSIMAEQFLTRLKMINNMNYAIDNEEFYLVYQPQVSVETGEVIAVEALVRWVNLELGRVSPAEFIPLAEKSGKISAIGRWIFEKACIDAMKWKVPWPVAINISGEQFKCERFFNDIKEILLKTGLPPERLTIEITETAFIENTEKLKIILEKFISLGVKISLDDFGTGYSSLNYLHNFPLNEIKIDKSFIDTIGTENEATAIIDAIIYLSNKLGYEIVAEGVETIEQLQFLKKRGCNTYQGYLYAKPLAQAEIIRKQEEIINKSLYKN